MSETCGTCEHWEPPRDGRNCGACQRYVIESGLTQASLPACGAYLLRGSAKGPLMSDERRCGTCRHYTPWRESDAVGECVRSPADTEFVPADLEPCRLWQPREEPNSVPPPDTPQATEA